MNRADGVDRIPHNGRALRAAFRHLCLISWLCLGGCATQQAGDPTVVTIIGTNDVHGELLPKEGRGGLVSIAGYVDALRRVRGNDNVLLIDAGDMWQGTLESNLNEGAVVVAAYNAMAYTAAAIGNHEFDFGPVGPGATPQPGDDPQSALKARAREAKFPLLAANLIDESTGLPVKWSNVQPSIIVNAGGVDVGIIGVVTKHAFSTTIAANTVGLRVAPLESTIRREATRLRDAGADLIIVSAHAGGRCHDFSSPDDLSSCELDGEIFKLASALPQGMVDHILGGHVHDGIAHVVNGVAITSAYSNTYAFSRVDFSVDTKSGEILGRDIFPPQLACPYRRQSDNACVWLPRQAGAGVMAARYEQLSIGTSDAVLAIALQAQSQARERKQEKIGVILETPFTLKGNPESALGNLMTDALLASIDADIAIHNVSGGIRAPLPAGELTFGDVYEMFPFDNRVVTVELSGYELRKVIASQALKSRRRVGFSGMRVTIRCDDDVMRIDMARTNGTPIGDSDVLRVIANEYLALGGDDILTPAMPAGGFRFPAETPRTRDVIVAWLRQQNRLRAEDFLTGGRPKWRVPADLVEACGQQSIATNTVGDPR